MNLSFDDTISVNVPGKTILIGEHSVVYGHGAIALALNDINLNLTLFSKQLVDSWENDWNDHINNEPLKPDVSVFKTLTFSLKKAFELFDLPFDKFKPCKIEIKSQIPLGGGMGGSAAISSALVLLCEIISNNKTLDLDEKIKRANEIDGLFHFGKASGLDVSAILSRSFIYFRKGFKTERIKSTKNFWIALVDSKTRAQTSEMVKKVSESVHKKDLMVLGALEELGILSLNVKDYLNLGNYNALCDALNKSHFLLNQIGVSTQKLDSLRNKLMELGACAAKITGAGGGGLILSVFKQKPEFLYNHFKSDEVFLTQIL